MKKLLRYFLIFSFILFNCNSLFAQHQYTWAIPCGGSATGGNGTTVTDTSGNVYVLGNFGYPLAPWVNWFDADPGTGSTILTTNGDDDIYLCKYNKNGALVWAKSFGGPSEDLPTYALAIDDNENIYIAGSFDGLVDFDPGPAVAMGGWANSVTTGTFISKFTASGDFVWVRTFRSSEFIQAVKTDNNGNVYAYGEFWYPMDIDPGPGIVTLQPNMTSNGTASTNFVLKLNADGIYINAVVERYGTVTDPYENVEYMEFNGGFAYTVNYAHVATFITKYDEDLNVIWIKSFDHCVANTVAVDNAGNVVCVGSYDINADFDPGPAVHAETVPNDNYQWLFVLKLNNHGDFQWVRTMGSDSASFAFADWVTVDHHTGEIYLTGRLDKAINFDGNNPNGHLESFPILEGFIEKLNADGSFSWVLPLETTGSSQGTFITMDEHKNLYISGRSYLNTDYNPDPNVSDTFSIDPPNEFLLKLSSPAHYSMTNISICPSPLPYSWNGNNYDATGNYTVLLTGADGIDSIPTLNLTVKPIAPVNLGNDTTLCTGQALTLNASYAGASYQWQDGSVNAGYTIIKAGVYGVSLNLNGCVSADTLIVDYKDCNCKTSIPNAFTPNGDGINDQWIIDGCDARYVVSVYNRYGSLVYHSENYHNEWKGTYGWKDCPDGTYYYIIRSIYRGQKEKILKGDITILR